MKFINNETEAVKVRAEGNEKLPPVFKTVKPGETINAESDDYIKGYKKKGLTAVKEVEETKDKPKDKEPEADISKEPAEHSHGVEDSKLVEKKKTEPVTSTPKTEKSSKKNKKK